MKVLDKIYINGEFITPHGTETLILKSPVSGEPLAQVRLASGLDTVNAINAAKEAFKTFSKTSKEERIGIWKKCTQ